MLLGEDFFFNKKFSLFCKIIKNSKKMIRFIATSIASKILKDNKNGELVLKMSDEAFSFSRFYIKNFNLNVINILCFMVYFGLC